jgi:hypothetical protein
MIEWLTNAGERNEDSEVFYRQAPLFQQGVRQLTNLANPSSGELSADDIARSVMKTQAGKRADYFSSLAFACLVLTGQSDNALKCQFPVFLVSGGYTEAQRFLRLRAPTPARPRLGVITMKQIAERMPEAENSGGRQVVTAYFQCLFGRANMTRMSQVITTIRGLSIAETSFVLEVMALSAIRGSATASGGHHPEEQLRSQMEEWGLIRGTDFNVRDVDARELAAICNTELTSEASEKAQKSRAFDFVLPYKVEGRGPRLLIQGQFYAGDSGSVSHKNVDQTPTGRSAAQEVVNSPLFAEFLDGAGYVTALAGDAERLLTMAGTDGLIQLNTAAIRLRELLQRINFATPLEVAHAVWESGSGLSQNVADVLSEQYSHEEVERAIAQAKNLQWLVSSGPRLLVSDAKVATALEYAVLDTVAIIAASVPDGSGSTEGVVVPGYGMNGWAISTDDVHAKLLEMLPGLPPSLRSSEAFSWAIENLKSKRRIHLS